MTSAHLQVNSRRQPCSNCEGKGCVETYPRDTVPHTYCFKCGTWSALGNYHPDPVTPERLQKILHEKEQQQREAAAHAEQLWNRAEPASSQHPYLVKKNIPPLGIRQRQQTLLIPLFDLDGKLWNIQKISNSDKFFLKNSRKQGCCMVIGHLPSPLLCFAEGYATAISIFQATQYATVVCFDAGNLFDVVMEFHRRYPDKQKIICADNDQFDSNGELRSLEKNVGVVKATKAAQAVNGILVIPQFNDLSTQPTDFNDMSNIVNLAEVRHQIQSALKTPVADLFPEVLLKLPTVSPCTHLANTYRIQHYFAGKIYYSLGLGWMIWTGQFWKSDPTGDSSIATGFINNLSRQIARESSELSRMASNESRENRRKSLMEQAENLLKWAVQSENERTIAAGLKLSKYALLIEYSALNANPWLFNVQNGTLDLRSGKLQPHNPLDLITFISPVAFDAQSQCPTWEKFLSEVFAGDLDMVKFMQRAIGWSLTGVVKERALFFLYGNSGKNGKSTLVETILKLMGICSESSYGYGRKVTADTFMKSRNHEDNQRKATTLAGPRFICSSEVDEEHRLNEQLIKDITGGDTLEARKLYQEAFTFTPQFKPWMYGNHKPEIRGTDDAIWSRVRLVPFEVSFQGREDLHLMDKLQDELPGILNWAIQGCLEWQRGGLQPPMKVRAATDAYRAEMDVFGPFIAEYCIIHPHAEVSSSDLWQSYNNWCLVNGVKEESQTKLGKYLNSKGFYIERGTGGRKKRLGIGLIV